MRVLVTGANGFTGKYVSQSLLSSGHEVMGLEADLLDSEAVSTEVKQKNPDAVIHLAAIAFVAHGDAEMIYRVNIIGTRNLLSALSEHVPNIKKVVLASSANVYGNNEGVMTEAAIPCPANDYAVSKLAMEQMSLLWSPKLPIVLARPFNYTGINQSENFLIPKIVKHFKAKQPYIELGNIDVWRDFGDVRAVANAYVGLAEKANAEDVFNICTGKLHALRDVIALCRDITQHDIEVIVNPAFIRENEVKSLCGDVTKLKNLIPDWEVPPLKTTLEWMLKS